MVVVIAAPSITPGIFFVVISPAPSFVPLLLVAMSSVSVATAVMLVAVTVMPALFAIFFLVCWHFLLCRLEQKTSSDRIVHQGFVGGLLLLLDRQHGIFPYFARSVSRRVGILKSHET